MVIGLLDTAFSFLLLVVFDVPRNVFVPLILLSSKDSSFSLRAVLWC